MIDNDDDIIGPLGAFAIRRGSPLGRAIAGNKPETAQQQEGGTGMTQLDLLKSFKRHVLDDQWSIESWIHHENVSADALDATIALVGLAVDAFIARMDLNKLLRERTKA